MVRPISVRSGSGDLDVSEMKSALQQLKSNVRGVADQMARQQAVVRSKRETAEVYRGASTSAAAYQAQEEELAALRRGSATTRLGTLLKVRNIKISELVASWDKDGNGQVVASEFNRHLHELGLQATDEELDELFNSLDHDRSGRLDLNEVVASFKKISANTLSAQNEVAAKTRDVAKAKRVAEAAQREARTAQLEADAKLEAEELAAKEAREAKAAEKAKAKAAEAAIQKERADRIRMTSAKLSFM